MSVLPLAAAATDYENKREIEAYVRKLKGGPLTNK
jgi:hypothetical protein